MVWHYTQLEQTSFRQSASLASSPASGGAFHSGYTNWLIILKAYTKEDKDDSNFSLKKPGLAKMGWKVHTWRLVTQVV